MPTTERTFDFVPWKPLPQDKERFETGDQRGGRIGVATVGRDGAESYLSPNSPRATITNTNICRVVTIMDKLLAWNIQYSTEVHTSRSVLYIFPLLLSSHNNTPR